MGHTSKLANVGRVNSPIGSLPLRSPKRERRFRRFQRFSRSAGARRLLNQIERRFVGGQVTRGKYSVSPGFEPAPLIIGKRIEPPLSESLKRKQLLISFRTNRTARFDSTFITGERPLVKQVSNEPIINYFSYLFYRTPAGYISWERKDL